MAERMRLARPFQALAAPARFLRNACRRPHVVRKRIPTHHRFITQNPLMGVLYYKMAERMRFELTIGLTLCPLSRRVP